MEEEQQVQEVQEEPKESPIVEKDGEIFVRHEEESSVEEKENPETDSGEQPVEEKSDVSGKEDVEDDIPSAYKEKSMEDVIKMHQEASKKISEQGSELGKLRKQTEGMDLSPEQLKEQLSAKDVLAGLESERNKLVHLDPIIEPDDYSRQQALVNQLETDWLEKRQDELIRNQFNSKDNKEFLEKQKKRFEDSGVELSSDEFKTVSDIAENYLVDGKYSESSFQKAMIDQFGVDKMVKFYTISGEKKAREDIQKAQSKKMEKVNVKGSGKNAKLVRLNDLSPQELNKTLGNMSTDELTELYSRVNK